MGSWWGGGDGVWTVTGEKAPCQKALKGYVLPSCFCSESSGEVDYEGWRKQAELCYSFESGYTCGMHSKYEWKHHRGTW